MSKTKLNDWKGHTFLKNGQISIFQKLNIIKSSLKPNTMCVCVCVCVCVCECVCVFYLYAWFLIVALDQESLKPSFHPQWLFSRFLATPSQVAPHQEVIKFIKCTSQKVKGYLEQQAVSLLWAKVSHSLISIPIVMHLLFFPTNFALGGILWRNVVQ